MGNTPDNKYCYRRYTLVFAIDNGVVAVRYELPLFDMLAAAACRTIDSLGSLNRYNYGIKNEWRFLNVVPLFDMFAAAACRTTDKIGSSNQRRNVKINVAALQQEWHKKIRVRIRTLCLHSL